MKRHRKRVCQVAECCGAKFRRWRYRADTWKNNPRCPVCNCLLPWVTTSGPGSPEYRYWKRQQEARKLAGLNASGKPYGRHPNFATEAERVAHRRERKLALWRERAERYKKAGLTSRGKPRKLNWIDRPASPVEIAWRQFREGI